MKEDQDPYQSEDEEEEINWIPIAKTLWKGRKTIFISLLVATVLGVVFAIISPKAFTATTIMVPQMGSKSGMSSSLGGLAALAGINIGMSEGGADLSPLIYPKIVSSVPFKLALMNTPIKFEDQDTLVTLFEYYTNPTYSKSSVLGAVKKYTIGLPGIIIGALKRKPKSMQLEGDAAKQLILLSEDQYKVYKMLDAMLTLEVEAKQGYLTLTAVMPEALAAAQLAEAAQQLLQRDITDFKIQKAQADLEFIQGRYDEAKAQAEGYQYSFAVKSDQYKNLTSAVPQVEATRIQTKYGIANAVFQELAKQLETAKIQVKKDTPVFTIVEPVTVPSEKSQPNRPMILMMWIFVGGIVGVGIVFGKGMMADLKIKWAEEE